MKRFVTATAVALACALAVAVILELTATFAPDVADLPAGAADEPDATDEREREAPDSDTEESSADRARDGRRAETKGAAAGSGAGLRLRVVARDGSPRHDIPVRLWPAEAPRAARLSYRSDHEGMVREPKFRALASEHGGPWVAAIDLPLRAPATTRFGLNAIREVIPLTLPELGSMDFTLVTATASRVRVPATLELRQVDAEGKELSASGRSVEPLAKFHDGVARIERVGLNTRFRARVRLGEAADLLSGVTRAQVFEAPHQARALRRHRLVIHERAVLVRGRALFGAGEALAKSTDTRLGLHGPGDKSTHGTRVGEDGAFMFLIEHEASGVHEFWLDAYPDSVHYAARAVATITGPGVQIDLREIVFSKAETLAAGRVVDRQNTAIESAVVTLRKKIDGRAKTVLPHHRNEASDRFSFEGIKHTGICSLQARAPGYTTTTRDIEIGDRDIVLTMDLKATLKLTAQIDPELVKPGLAHELRLFLREEQKRERFVDCAVGKDGKCRFALHGLRPGTYALALRLQNWPKPLWSTTKHILEPGLNTISGIDLRSRLYRFEFRADFPDGAKPKAMPYLSIRHRESATSTSWQTYQMRAPVLVVSPTASIDFVGTVAGYKKRSGHALVGRNVLRFEPEAK